jgi:hypothetical protein
VPTVDLTDDEFAAVTAAVRRTIENDRFPRAPRLDPLRSALAKLEPATAPKPTPHPKAPPPAKADKPGAAITGAHLRSPSFRPSRGSGRGRPPLAIAARGIDEARRKARRRRALATCDKVVRAASPTPLSGVPPTPRYRQGPCVGFLGGRSCPWILLRPRWCSHRAPG